MDPIAQLKEMQKKSWSPFSPYENHTCLASPHIATFAGIVPGQRVLDVACGTGVLALASARAAGGTASGVDFNTVLLERARENAAIAKVAVDFREGDVEALPYEDATFDVVVSQFGHMFALRPDVAVREMLRVLKPGGTIAFATWPPGLFSAEMLRVVARFGPPPPPGIASPIEWGKEDVVRQRLGDAAGAFAFEHGVVDAPYVSVAHVRHLCERGIGPILGLVQLLEKTDPPKLAEMREAIDQIASRFYDPARNVLKMEYLVSRAIKH